MCLTILQSSYRLSDSRLRKRVYYYCAEQLVVIDADVSSG